MYMFYIGFNKENKLGRVSNEVVKKVIYFFIVVCFC